MANNISYLKTIEILKDFFGNYKRLSNNEFMFECPFCGSSKRKKPHFGVDISKDVYNCFRCGKSGRLSRLLKEHYKINIYIRQQNIKKDIVRNFDFVLLDDISEKSKEYIDKRLDYNKFYKKIIYDSYIDVFFIKYKNVEYLALKSIYESYISIRSLTDNVKNKKMLFKINSIDIEDFFGIMLNRNKNNKLLNVFIFEGLFDMLTHIIHLNKSIENSFYIIFNGKIIMNKIYNILDLYFSNNSYTINIFKDSDRLINEFYNRYNCKTKIIWFEKSKDLNESYILYKFKDMKEKEI